MVENTLTREQRKALLTILDERFGMEDLEVLCYCLDVDLDDLSGKTISTKAIAIIEHFLDRGSLPDLLKYIHENRPDCDLSLFDGLPPRGEVSMTPLAAAKAILENVRISTTAYRRQCGWRDELVAMLLQHFPNVENDSYEDLFCKLYDQMNIEERDYHLRIRALTEGVIYECNKKNLEIIRAVPELKEKIPSVAKLMLHLTLWLARYESAFQQNRYMCLVYVGPSKQYSFPREVAADLEAYIARAEAN